MQVFFGEQYRAKLVVVNVEAVCRGSWSQVEPWFGVSRFQV